MKLKHRIYPISVQEGDTINNDINLEDEKDVRLVIDDIISEVLLTDIFKKVYYDDGDLEGFSLLFKAENANGETIEDGNILIGGKKIHLYIPEKDKHVFFTKIMVPNTIASSVSVGANHIIGVSKLIGILDKAVEVFGTDLNAEEIDAIAKEAEIERSNQVVAETQAPENTKQTPASEGDQIAQLETVGSEISVVENATEQVTVFQNSEGQEVQPLEASSEPIAGSTETTQVETTPEIEVFAGSAPSSQETTPVISGEPANAPEPITPPVVEEKIEEVEEKIEHEILRADEKEEEPEAKNWWNKIRKELKAKFLEENNIPEKYLESSYDDIHFKRRWLKWTQKLIDSNQYQEIRRWFGKRGFEEYINNEYHFFYGDPIEDEDAYPFVILNHGKGQFEELDGGIVDDNDKTVEFEFIDGNTNYSVKLDKEKSELTVSEKVAQN